MRHWKETAEIMGRRVADLDVPDDYSNYLSYASY
jgi:hypothetical protein